MSGCTHLSFLQSDINKKLFVASPTFKMIAGIYSKHNTWIRGLLLLAA